MLVLLVQENEVKARSLNVASKAAESVEDRENRVVLALGFAISSNQSLAETSYVVDRMFSVVYL